MSACWLWRLVALLVVSLCLAGCVQRTLIGPPLTQAPQPQPQPQPVGGDDGAAP
jgi:hypothetical protein